MQELSFKNIELRYLDTPNLCIMAVRAKCVAESLGRHGHRRNHETMHSEGGDRKARHPCAHLIDVVKSYEEA